MTQDYNQAAAYITALTQCDPSTVLIDVRMIHDTNKEVPAIPMRGTLPDLWQSICYYNNNGYGGFVNISDMDGVGRETANVRASRVAVIDLDNINAQQNFERAIAWTPAPQFGVQSSPGRYHVYWCVPYYSDNDHFTLRQRKLCQFFDSDKRIIDAARVLRLPGTIHTKAEPYLVTCFTLPGYGQITSHEAIDAALQAVNVIDGGQGVRQDLGAPELAAPSLEWLQRALDLVDPNALDRSEWIALTSAVKQSGYSLTDPDTLFTMWSNWCARYDTTDAHGKPMRNDPGENHKQWHSIRNTELGWPSLLRRVPSLQAAISFGNRPHDTPVPATAPADAGTPQAVAVPPMPEPPPLDCTGEYLTHLEQAEWFDGCTFIVQDSAVFTPNGRFLNATQFNVVYGGKKFIIDSAGKTVNEAWQAATRSTLWQLPKVDHRRFVPQAGFGEIIIDALGRDGINTYKPIIVKRAAGDASPFVHHIMRILPDPRDQRIIFDYLAHNAKYPGHKIPWAPVIQSAEGVGKGIMKSIMMHVMGRPYVYYPNAKELTNSGSQFNAWMRNKLFILADEIKVDDRRDLIEVLKPMISEEIIEMQSKGVDQELEDNFSNWFFFTNWKDAIPINKNSRRFAIMYSQFQTAQDLILAGMDEAYFNNLYNWARADGAAIVANWLLEYPIERGAIPMRAPETSSAGEAITMSRSPLERIIWEAVDDGLPGFKGGWVSSVAVIRRVRETGALRTAPPPQAISTVLEGMGYVACGRADREFFSEGHGTGRAYLYHIGAPADVAGFGPAQGYAM